MAKSNNRTMTELIGPDRKVALGPDSGNIITLIGEHAFDSSDKKVLPLQYFSTLDSLPTTNLVLGEQAFVTATSRLYVSNGSGWYNVAFINSTPTLTVTPSGTVALSTDGSTTVIRLLGADSDNSDDNLTYSVESGGDFFKMATLVQDSAKQFTITPRSSDSYNTLASDGSSTLTFKVTDGIAVASGVNTFTLTYGATYSNKLSSTDYAIGTSGTTFETSIKKQGTHSYYAVGNGVTSRNPGANSASAVTYNDFTIAMWFYIQSFVSYGGTGQIHLFTTNDKLGGGYSFGTKGNNIQQDGDYWFVTDNYNGSTYGGMHANIGGSAFVTGAWYHLVFSASTTGPAIGVWLTKEGQSFGNVINRETFGGTAVASRVTALKIGGSDGLYIHGSNGNAADGGNVYYDDLRIYDAKASATDAEAIFNSAGDVTAATNPLQSNLKLAYTFDNTANSI